MYKYPSIRSFCPLLLIAVMSLSACDDSRSSRSQNDYSGQVEVDLQAAPVVKWNGSNGKTTVVLQYAVRGSDAQPLALDDVNVELLVNDQIIDNESLLDKSAEELQSNLYFSMVLDASYSMTQHNPPAFEPMKKAAQDSYQSILDMWADRPGETRFSVVWFDEVINQSIDNPNLDRRWQPADILSIPAPVAGTATKLHAAVYHMTSLMKQAYDSNLFVGDQDHYVMLVFSDGADNYSFWSQVFGPISMTTDSGASYLQYGSQAVTLEQTVALIQEHPKLTVHVIGLGSAINTQELQALADAGKGLYLQNPSSDRIDELFERVTREFSTLQTTGATIPLPPGDYTFKLLVRNAAGNREDAVQFSFHAGDANSRLLSVDGE